MRGLESSTPPPEHEVRGAHGLSLVRPPSVAEHFLRHPQHEGHVRLPTGGLHAGEKQVSGMPYHVVNRRHHVGNVVVRPAGDPFEEEKDHDDENKKDDDIMTGANKEEELRRHFASFITSSLSASPISNDTQFY